MFEGSHALQIADAVAVPCPDAVTVGFTQVALPGADFEKGGLGVNLCNMLQGAKKPVKGHWKPSEPPKVLCFQCQC